MSRILFFQSNGEIHNEKEIHSWLPFGEACFSLTPKVSVPGQQQVLLDVESTQTYFGGEENILRALAKLSTTFGVQGHTVLTDRPEWARVFATTRDVFIPVGQSHTQLLKLPIERLQLCGNPFTIDEELPERESLTAFMRRVGMDRIEHFTQLTPTAIGRRFGKLGMTLQQWVMGERQLSLPILEPTGRIEETIDTEEITCLDSLAFYLQEVLARIEARLTGRELLAQQLNLSFFLESSQKIQNHMGLSEPLRDALSLFRLLMGHLEKMQWDSPLQRLEICVSESVPATPGQLSLWDNSENKKADMGNFVRHLRYRYGENNVGFARLAERHLPEFSWENTWPPIEKETRDFPSPPFRPLFIYASPRSYRVPPNTRLIPTENLDVEWWDTYGSRRYFTAITPGREALWIFWDLTRQQWFIHGCFD